MGVQTSIVARNAALNAIAALASGGVLRVYSGTLPAHPEMTVVGVLLAECVLNTPAFGPAIAGVLTANSVFPDVSVNNTGVAGWFRVFATDGVTPLFDGNVTTSGGGGVMTMPTTTLIAGTDLNIASLTYTLPQ